MFIERRFCTQASGNGIKNRLQVETKGRCKENVSMTSSIKCIIFGNPLSLPKNSLCISTLFHLVWKAQHSTLCGKQNIPLRVESTTFHFVWKAQHSTLCGQNIVHLVWTKYFLPTLCWKIYLFH